MRRALLPIALAAACYPGCLCVANFPDHLLGDDRGPGDGRGEAQDGARADRRGRDAPDPDGGARDSDHRLDGPRRDRRPDGPRVDLRNDIVAACNGTSCKCSGCSCTDAGACKVPCGGAGVTCPPGVHCAIAGGATCTGQVFCGQASVCTVICDGANACTNQIHCDSAKQCFVTCSNGACSNHISCGSGYCEVRCKGQGSCANNVACDIASCGCLVDCAPASCGGPGSNYLSKVNCLVGCSSGTGCNACVTPPCFAP